MKRMIGGQRSAVECQRSEVRGWSLDNWGDDWDHWNSTPDKSQLTFDVFHRNLVSSVNIQEAT